MRVCLALIIIGSILGACQNSSYSKFKEKGQSKSRSLIDELKMVRTKDQLVERRHSLRRYFDDLADLNDQAKSYALNHPSEPLPLMDLESKELSDLLRQELLRVYRLDGGREIIDECRQNKKCNLNY